MNVIFILCDTLVRDKLSPYHKNQGPYGRIRTPNLERLAKKSVTFANHWLNSAPCMPARRDLFSGRIEFPWRSWGPRESFDPDWTLTLRQSQVLSGMFTDHANLFDVGAGNYHHFFDFYQFIRGHFNDHQQTPEELSPGRKGLTRNLYKKERQKIGHPDQTFVSQNLGAVTTWLDNYSAGSSPFFLYVDEFDPHWPLDPPEPYRSMYLPPDLQSMRHDGFYWTDGRYLLCKGPEQEGPLFQYGTDFGEKWVGIKGQYFDRYEKAETGQFLPHTDRPVYRVPSDGLAYGNPRGDFDALFDLRADPACQENLYEKNTILLDSCLRKLVTFMENLKVPHEHFKRLGLKK